tara:strand:- start:414 stop:1307 length:894 start_codon:yes stop_codon:yes gene_type:complete
MSWWSELIDYTTGDKAGEFDVGEALGDALGFFTGDLPEYLQGNAGPLLGMGLAYLANKSGLDDQNIPVVGYQGGIPEYQAVRQRVPMEQDPNRRPGAGGRRYFTDTIFAQKPETTPMTAEEAKAAADAQAQGLAGLNPTYDPPPAQTKKKKTTGTTAGTGYGGPGPRVGMENPNYVEKPRGSTDRIGMPQVIMKGEKPSQVDDALERYGFMAGGRYLNGATDGMADEVPANVGRDEVRLSDGEFVIPADVVSHLGNGNSNAGAAFLHKFMNDIRQERTGNAKQGKEVDPRDFVRGMA